MSVANAARLSGMTLLVAALYSAWYLLPGLFFETRLRVQAAWLSEQSWHVGVASWLWLLAILCWMVLLVSLAWHLLPAHRMSGALQSGIMVIAGVLKITGIAIAMHVLPVAVDSGAAVVVVVAFGVGLLQSGLFMGAAVSAWLVYDLARNKVMARASLALPMLGSLAVIAAALFLDFQLYLLGVGTLLWLVWCGWLAFEPRMAQRYVIWAD